MVLIVINVNYHIMAFLPESSEIFPQGITQVEFDELGYGGAENIDKTPNKQYIELANRTTYLKKKYDDLLLLVNDLKTDVEALQAQVTNYQPKNQVLTEISGLSLIPGNFLIGIDENQKVMSYAANAFQPANNILSELSGISLLPDRLLGTDANSQLTLKVPQPPMTTTQINVVILTDRKPTGIVAGDGTINTWNTRTLNTKQEIGESFCVLNGNNTFVLDPGSYLFWARIPATMTDKHMGRLVEVPSGNLIGFGSSTQTVAAEAISGQSFTTDTWIFTSFSISIATSYSLQHWIAENYVSRAFGAEVGIQGALETYAQVTILKVR